MAPAKGNQHAKGHGRPPNEGFADKDLLVYGEELIAWIKNHPDAIHLSEWYSRIRNMYPSQWQSIKRRECFIPYYEKALEWLSVNIMKNKELASSYCNRLLTLYSREIADHEREKRHEEIDYEIKAKTEAEKTNIGMPNDKLLAMITSLVKQVQSLKDELEIEKTKRSPV